MSSIVMREPGIPGENPRSQAEIDCNSGSALLIGVREKGLRVEVKDMGHRVKGKVQRKG